MKKPPSKTKILLVEDHQIMRQGLERLINLEEDMVVCGGADNASEAMEKIEKLKPDLIITDISLNGMNGIEFLKHLKARHPTLPAVVLSMHDESLYAERALRAGALAFVMKRENSREVMLAIRKACRGEYHVSEKVGGGIFNKFVNTAAPKQPAINSLSDRELEVFELLGHGLGSKDIAKQLHLSVKTVDTHRGHIKEKLELRNFTELIQRAAQWVQRDC